MTEAREVNGKRGSRIVPVRARPAEPVLLATFSTRLPARAAATLAPSPLDRIDEFPPDVRLRPGPRSAWDRVLA